MLYEVQEDYLENTKTFWLAFKPECAFMAVILGVATLQFMYCLSDL